MHQALARPWCRVALALIRTADFAGTPLLALLIPDASLHEAGNGTRCRATLDSTAARPIEP